MDEATGIDAEIWEAIDGVLSGANTRLLAIGNPTNATSEFNKRTKQAGDEAKVIRITAFDTPNFTEGGIIEVDIATGAWKAKLEVAGGVRYAYLASPAWVARIYEKYGPESAMYLSRVKAIFPTTGSDALIPLARIERAQQRWQDFTDKLHEGSVSLDGKERVLGVDVAEFGCFDDQTEILTGSGWRLFDQLRGDEQVLSLKDDQAEWAPITQVHRYPYTGELNLYESQKVNFCVTDNHQLVVKTSPKSSRWIVKRYDHCAQTFVIRRGNSWGGTNPDVVTFTAQKRMPPGGFFRRQWQFSMQDWAAFLGWFVAEGNVTQERRKAGRLQIFISQYPGVKCDRLRRLLWGMGILFNRTGNQFRISNNVIGKHLMEHCGVGAANKRIPHYIKESTPEVIRAFLDAILLGDGTVRADGTGRCFSTTSRLLADDIQECLIKLGRAGKVTHRPTVGTSTVIDERQMTRIHDQYVVYERGRGIGMEIRKANVRRVAYKGFVYCVSTPHRTIMVRHKGCPMWSGNSDSTARTLRIDQYVAWQRVTSQDDTMITTGRVAVDLHEDETIHANIDVVGIGNGVARRLEELFGERATGVNVGERAEEPDRFINKKAELFWQLRTLFEQGGIMIPPDEDLTEELSAIKYKVVDSTGKIRITGKDELRKPTSLGRSPDRADSLMLSIAKPPEEQEAFVVWG